MAHDYPLEELSPRAFEQLIVALALKVFGPGIEAFGSGPDGGREATFRGRIDWSKTDPRTDAAWNGYTVFQAKQSEQYSPDPARGLRWLRDQIDAELDSWMSNASKRGQFPDYLVFVTNVRLSSVPGSGIDALNAHIARRLNESWDDDKRDTLRARGLRDWKIWHRDQLNGLITAEASVRQAFKGLLTVGDLMSRLGELGGTLEPEHLIPVLSAHGTNTLTNERWVSFREAGGATRESVDNIVIDLSVDASPFDKTTESAPHRSVLREVFVRSDMVLKPSVIEQRIRRHIVLTGQAGSGKSTITRFLTQAVRAEFVRQETLTPTETQVLEGTAKALTRLGVSGPRGKRWPMRVNLAEFADAIGPDGSTDLLRWLADRVSSRANLDIKPIALLKWLTYWPCLIVFDGLDEVTAPEVRPRVLDEITSFVERADRDDADLLVVVTTRPTGYTERLMPTHFQQLDLTYLQEQEAVDYGRLVTERRLSDDLDRRDQLVASFEKHAKQPTMLRLMKTPLQVLIMTMVLERTGALPADRFQLFSFYFDTIYERESAKPTSLAPLLSQQRALIFDLHEGAGLALQQQSELSGDARAVLSTSELRLILEARLSELGHEPGSGRNRIADQVMQATTERLVLLVPAEDDSVAFEVRSLQELMAARALAKGTDAQLRRRLTLAAPSPHWRNTWVFMAGALFAQGGDHRREIVVDVVESIDREPTWPGWLSPTGPELAAALLDDGLAIRTPKWQRRLTDVALRALTAAFPPDPASVALGLRAAIDSDNGLRVHIRNALKLALAGAPRAAIAARLLLSMTHVDLAIPAALIRNSTMSTPELSGWVLAGPILRAQIPEMPEPELTAELLAPVLGELDDLKIAPHGSGDIGLPGRVRVLPWDGPFVAAVNDPLTGDLLELLIGSLDPEQWQVHLGIGILYRVGASRKPIGSDLE